MGGKPATWWIMLAAGIFAAAFLLKDFMDHGHAILAHAGYKGLLTSPTIHHKIGEALIGVILFMTALMRSIWTPERLIANLKASYPLMLVGAALNALAWFGSGLPATDFNKIDLVRTSGGRRDRRAAAADPLVWPVQGDPGASLSPLASR